MAQTQVDREAILTKPDGDRFTICTRIVAFSGQELRKLTSAFPSSCEHERNFCGAQFSSITASIDGNVEFHPADNNNGFIGKLRDNIVLEKTNLVHRMFQGLGEMPFFLAQHAGARHVLYGYVGTEDYTLDPLIRPGAFVQIDPRQTKVVKGVWPNEHHRPIYFVELRDNLYACSWCDYEGSRLLLVPSPKSPVPIRSFRYPQDAEIVGRVTGIAMMIAQLQPDTISDLPRT